MTLACSVSRYRPCQVLMEWDLTQFLPESHWEAVSHPILQMRELRLRKIIFPQGYKSESRPLDFASNLSSFTTASGLQFEEFVEED